jgi:uncharacterized protein
MFSTLTGRNVYLDSNIIVFAVERGSPWSGILSQLFQAIDRGAVHAFTSELTIAEVLVKPISLAARDAIEAYNKVLATDSTIEVIPINRAILNFAAEFRARTKAKLVDVIHAATARFCACNFFVTNDAELGRKADSETRWLPLSALAETQ